MQAQLYIDLYKNLFQGSELFHALIALTIADDEN